MSKISSAVISGVLIGVAAVLAGQFFLSSQTHRAAPAVRDIVNVPTMANDIADRHREEQYKSILSIQDVVTLPSEFSRSEATHTLAGRSDSATLQGHIFEADRIADDQQREAILNVLFFRLAEVDPQSALVLSRDNPFKALRSLQQTVWMAWGNKDLSAALFEAKTQTSVAHANAAAQNLYAAFGFLGNATTDRIEAELGIPPDRATRARYLYRMADESPQETIEFINGVSRTTLQREYVSWLAYYLSMSDPEAALGYARHFAAPENSDTYSRILNQIVARATPRITIDRLLSEGLSINSQQVRIALEAFAELELDVAIQYFESVNNVGLKQSFGKVIAAKLAREDTADALRWARENDTNDFPYLEHSVLNQLLLSDPERAMREAMNSPHAEGQDQLLGVVVGQVARRNPAMAVAYLEQIEESPEKRQAQRRLAMNWIRQDPEAALDWVMTRDEESKQELIQTTLSTMINSDVDAAIRLLPLIGKNDLASAKQQIIHQLATKRSAAEAQAFVRQFEGEPGHAQLQASLVYGIAEKDPALAKQMADQLPAGTAREQAYAQLVTQRAQKDPADAARWLEQVSDPRMRTMATSQIASRWYQKDPSAAMRWVTDLPSGKPRDQAIASLSGQWHTVDASRQALIDSISNRDMRGQAKMQRAYNLMRSDPVKARALLADEDITDAQREQFEQVMVQYGID